MSGYLVFPVPMTPELLSSATSQAGARCSGIIANAGNGGAIAFTALGTISEGLDPLIELTVDGDLQTTEFKYSDDGGTTYLGRQKDSVWDDGAEGGGNTLREILATGTNDCVSNPVEIDSDADGVPDMVLIAISDSTAGTVKLYSTSDFTGAGAWTLRSTIAAASSESCGSLIVSGQTVWAIYSANDDDIQMKKSINSGLTWGSAKEIAATTVQQVPRGMILSTGFLAVVYLADDGGYDHVYIKTSQNDGASWSTAKKVTAAGSVDYASPSIVELYDSGRTVVVGFRRVTATAAVQARQVVASRDPARYGTWEDYGEDLTTFTTATTITPQLMTAPDGTVYVFAIESAVDGVLVYSKLKGSGVFPAAATVFDEPSSHTLARPACGVIGGALWCAYIDTTDSDAEMRLAKYWIAYDETDAPASWTGKAWGFLSSGLQFLGSGLWVLTGGANGIQGDLWEGVTVYDYGAHRMICLRPGMPSRSVADNAAWNAVFDLDAIGLHGIDTICAMSNLDHLHLQMNATDSWGSPSVDTTVSFVQETIASYTIATGKVTRSSGTWVAGVLKGLYVFFGTGSTGYRIVDNTSTVIYTYGDPTGETGDMKIRATRAWSTQTLSAYRYLRVYIDAQYTAEGYYQIPALFVGTRHALALGHKHIATRWIVAANDLETDGKSVQRTLAHSTPRRRYPMKLIKPTTAQYQELATQIRNLGARPLAYIPDTTNAYDWILGLPDSAIQWEGLTTQFDIVEVL